MRSAGAESVPPSACRQDTPQAQPELPWQHPLPGCLGECAENRPDRRVPPRLLRGPPPAPGLRRQHPQLRRPLHHQGQVHGADLPGGRRRPQRLLRSFSGGSSGGGRRLQPRVVGFSPAAVRHELVPAAGRGPRGPAGIQRQAAAAGEVRGAECAAAAIRARQGLPPRDGHLVDQELQGDSCRHAGRRALTTKRAAVTRSGGAI